MPTTVEVLLATYDGARYLREQIDSILAQDDADLRVLARDDGSSDGTVAILNEYAERFPGRFRVMPAGPATGNAKDNFLLLMKAATAEYICFSDQDDVWLPDKVSTSRKAMEQLESKWEPGSGTGLPLLVFTDLRVVDDQLRTLHASFWAHEIIKPERIHLFAAVLAQNVVTGCTMMMNRPLLELALRMPEEAFMHDQWIALLACVMGKASVVKAQTVLYRQHDRNVIGVQQRIGSLSELTRRFRNTEVRLLQWKISQRQAGAFLRVHGDELSAENREVLRAYLRCGSSRSRLVRIYILIRFGFLRTGLLRKLALFVDLWMMKVEEHG
jgi:glycosyltransferase involved in cell wall biosynthesis